MKRHEDLVQRAVVQHLRLRSRPGVTWFAVPNGGARSPVEASVMKGLGVRAGVPDLIIIREGRTFALELKREKGGRTSEAQLGMIKEFQAAGVTCAVSAGIDQAVSQLKEWGVIR